MSILGLVLLGVVLLILAFLLPVPYVVWLLLILGAVVCFILAAYYFFTSGRPRRPIRRL